MHPIPSALLSPVHLFFSTSNVIFWRFTNGLLHSEKVVKNSDFRAVPRIYALFLILTGSRIKYSASSGRNTPGYG